jgi:hypothetical protein
MERMCAYSSRGKREAGSWGEVTGAKTIGEQIIQGGGLPSSFASVASFYESIYMRDRRSPNKLSTNVIFRLLYLSVNRSLHA